MSYNILKSDGTLFFTLDDGQIEDASTSLTFVGKNTVNYGRYQNENFLYLLENFADITEPPSPTAGQLWFDKTTDVLRMKVFNGSSWNSVPNFVYSPTSVTQQSGDFWFDTSNEALYIKSNASYILIGGANAASVSTGKLAVPVNINGTPFDGSTDVTIHSTTFGTLNKGNYLIGNNFNGGSTTTWAVDVGSVIAADPNKVVARNNNGDAWINVMHGTASSSQYADLAEKYVADKEYPIGTVVSIGGSAEVCACSIGDRAIGAVSGHPGYMMNSTLVNGTFIALKGRVPVKIQGTVKKGDRLIAGNDGCAVSTNVAHVDTFAIALEDSNLHDTVEALIL